MARALSICLVLLCCSGVAYGDKPRIAVLGLEVTPGPAGAIDPGAVLIAKEVTRELRQRVQAPSCPYAMAPNSSKELVDEKLLMSCDSEAPDCMVLIGAGLASDALLYGRVEKRGDSFRSSLKLLDVKRKQIQPAIDDLAGGGVAAGVRRLYRKLIGDGPSNEGSVVIRARNDAGGPMRGGAVILDDQVRGTLSNGKLAVTGVPEGRHTVAIAVGGFRRFEEIVNVRGGEQTTIDAVLHTAPVGEPMPGVAPPAPPVASAAPLPAAQPEDRAAGPSPLWKVSLAVGAAGVVGGGVYAWYSYDRQQAQAAHVQTGAAIDSERCDDSDAALLAVPGVDAGVLHAFRRACTWHTQTFIGYTVAGLGAAAALVSLIMLSRDPGPREGAATRVRGTSSRLAIAPLIAPNVAGAQLGLSW